jgi:PAS domain S-box-containing protein
VQKKSSEYEVVQKRSDPSIPVTLKFVGVGILWILFSDRLISYIIPSDYLLSLEHLQLLKGIVFVGVTGAVIFTISHDYAVRMRVVEQEQDFFFTGSPVAMVLLDPESFRLRKVNESAARIFGFPAAEFSHLFLTDLINKSDEESFRPILLFIRTGFDKLGVWRFQKKDGTFFSAEITSRRLNHNGMAVVSFVDVTEQQRVERQLSQVTRNLHVEIARRTEYLERANEELAYRASQTEHVNEELIHVNERLLEINKKIAAETEMLHSANRTVEDVLSTIRIGVWGYYEQPGDNFYVSSSVYNIFDAPERRLTDPWFWLEYIHPDENVTREGISNKFKETGDLWLTLRVVTHAHQTRRVLLRLKSMNDPNNRPFVAVTVYDCSSPEFVDVFSGLSRLTNQSSGAYTTEKIL